MPSSAIVGDGVANGPLGFTRTAVEALAREGSAAAIGLADRLAALALYETLAPPEIKPGSYWRVDISQLDFSTFPVYAAHPPVTQGSSLPPTWTILPSESRAALFVQRDATPIFTEIGERAARSGVIVCDLAHAKTSAPQAFFLGFHALVGAHESKFTALCTALQSGGAFVYVPDGIHLEEPIVITYVSDRAAIFPHTVVVVGSGSEVTIIEQVIAADDHANAPAVGIAEVIAGENAQVTFAALQTLPRDAIHLCTQRGAPAKDAEIRFAIAQLGGKLVVSDLDLTLGAPGATAQTNGLFFATASQHLDLTANVRHRVGSTFSTTVFKGAARDGGQARFRGNIRIAEAAHNAEASLREDALLLSTDAHIDSVPGLEIAANDVKAYHGTTVGAIDEEVLFYVTTRGIARDEAERLIALGFFEPVIAHFPGEPLRDRLRGAIEERIG